jgi:hypothetical protein
MNPATQDPRFMTSADDGNTWTQRTPAAPTTDVEFLGVSCTASVNVAVGRDQNGNTTTINSSPTGTTWTARTGDTATGIDLFDVAWNGSLFVAVGRDFTSAIDPKIMTSPDGTTWTARTASPTTSANLGGIASSGGAFIAVGHDDSITNPIIMYSADGLTWAVRTPNPTTNAILYDVAAIP